LLTLFCDELVEQICARHPGPAVAVAERNGVGDLIAAPASEAASKAIAKERVLAFALARPIDPG
jgi:hypothetical protein